MGYTGIEEQKEDISVYPSLANDMINVQVTPSANLIEIYSSDGRRVYQGKPMNSIEKINISGLRSGTYVVVVKSADKFWSKKIVKH